jgi:hypothetical protein
MDVYIFKSKHLDAYKVGHFLGWNAWGRIAFREFNSCIVPLQLQKKVEAEYFILVRWYPLLNQTMEKHIHERFIQSKLIGEWYSNIDDILLFCDTRDVTKVNTVR